MGAHPSMLGAPARPARQTRVERVLQMVFAPNMAGDGRLTLADCTVRASEKMDEDHLTFFLFRRGKKSRANERLIARTEAHERLRGWCQQTNPSIQHDRPRV